MTSKNNGMDARKTIHLAWGVGGIIFLSRIFGLFRDIIMAAFFGGSIAMDAFVTAFRFPNMFRSLLGEGALSSAFVPVLTEEIKKKSYDEAKDFVARMMGGLMIVLLVAVGVGMFFSLVLLPLFQGRIALTIELFAIMLPFAFFICLIAFLSAILNVLRRFYLPAVSQVIINLILIFSLVTFCPLLSEEGHARIKLAAFTVPLAGAIALMVMGFAVKQAGFLVLPRFSFKDQRIKKVVKLMSFSSLGVGISQISVVLDSIMALALGAGYASYLYYSERILYLPLGIFAVSLGTVLLPTFSDQVATNNKENLLKTLNHSLRHIIFVMTPLSLTLLALSEPIVKCIYERKQFDASVTYLTALALAVYAPALIAFSLQKVLVPVFYAHQDMVTPVKVGVVCTVCNIILKLILMWHLKHVGIVLSTVLFSFINCLTLAFMLTRRFGNPGWKHIAISFFKNMLASLVMAVLALWCYRMFLVWAPFSVSTLLNQIFSLAAGAMVGMIGFVCVALLIRIEELKELVRTFGF
jgi:putative peptidoglycan lipid II flippase